MLWYLSDRSMRNGFVVLCFCFVRLKSLYVFDLCTFGLLHSTIIVVLKADWIRPV